jgi:hypothetical protein
MTMLNDLRTITAGLSAATVNPAAGGRITSFRLKGYEFLTSQDIHPENYGSTLWPSPQSSWNWPPPAVLDNEPYVVERDQDVIQLRSGVDPVTGFQFCKRIAARGKNGVRLDYAIGNQTREKKTVAPWEITRVHKGGILFFPLGAPPPGKKHFDAAPATVLDGVLWYRDPPGRPPVNQLTIADGAEGWVAYAIEGRLFVKHFRDVPPEAQAPGEAEVLFYVSSVADYLEVEVQGRYEEVSPGGTLDWSIDWLGAELPAGLRVAEGSTDLVTFVRGLIRPL